MTQVVIKRGSYRNTPVVNETFELTRDFKMGKKGGFVTVMGNGTVSFPRKEIRVKVDNIRDVMIVSNGTAQEYVPAQPAAEPADERDDLRQATMDVAADIPQETDEEAIERIKERFDILDEMTQGTVDGTVRAMIVSGPPGVGKSFGVEAVLQRANLFNTVAQAKPKYEVVKGAMSALGLYAKLYEYSDAGSVLVFDDCDSVLLDDVALNILKAALDSSKKRYISWNSDSRLLRTEGIPDKFEFKGSAIFITNIKFEHVRSKKLKDHLDALESRCHYLDLTMNTARDKILRIRQIVRDGMLNDYGFNDSERDGVVQFIEENSRLLRELSLRMVLKIADLRKMSPSNWQRLAQTTCMRRGA